MRQAIDRTNLKPGPLVKSTDKGNMNHFRMQLLVAKLLFAVGFTDHCFSILCRLKATKSRLPGIDLLRARCRMRKSLLIEAREMLKEELRLHPDCKEASGMLADLGAAPANGDACYAPEFQEILAKIGPYTMLSQSRLHALYQAALDACERDMPGNFAECGVAGGGSSALLAWVIKNHSKRRRRLFSFDTFEGMPTPTAADTYGGVDALSSGWADGTCAAPIESVLRAAAELDAQDVILPVKGLFADTLPRMRSEVGSLCLLHLDGDWYESTRDILVNLFDLIVPGGYLQVDDYGYWDGCKRAVHEFEASRGLNFSVNPIDATGVWFRKTNA